MIRINRNVLSLSAIGVVMNQIAAIVLCVVALNSCRDRGSDKSSAKSQAGQADDSIRATIEVIKPVNLDAINTSWQTGRKISETSNTVTVEIAVMPFKNLSAGVVPNSNWRQENAANSELVQYLKPGATSNWDEAMKIELLALLKADGIDSSALNDLDLVQSVSNWIMKSPGRFQHKSFFIPFYVSFASGTPTVVQDLRQPFDAEKTKAGSLLSG